MHWLVYLKLQLQVNFRISSRLEIDFLKRFNIAKK